MAVCVENLGASDEERRAGERRKEVNRERSRAERGRLTEGEYEFVKWQRQAREKLRTCFGTEGADPGEMSGSANVTRRDVLLKCMADSEEKGGGKSVEVWQLCGRADLRGERLTLIAVDLVSEEYELDREILGPDDLLERLDENEWRCVMARFEEREMSAEEEKLADKRLR